MISKINVLDLIFLSVLQFVQELGQHVSICHESVGSSNFSLVRSKLQYQIIRGNVCQSEIMEPISIFGL